MGEGIGEQRRMGGEDFFWGGGDSFSTNGSQKIGHNFNETQAN